MKALHPLAPPRPPGSPGAFALTPPGLLEDLVAASGLTTTDAGYIELPYEYPDQATMLRAQGSSAPAVLAARTSGEAKVTEALVGALEAYRTPAGGYRLRNAYRYVTVTHPT
jgi:hypothetical protein